MAETAYRYRDGGRYEETVGGIVATEVWIVNGVASHTEAEALEAAGLPTMLLPHPDDVNSKVRRRIPRVITDSKGERFTVDIEWEPPSTGTLVSPLQRVFVAGGILTERAEVSTAGRPIGATNYIQTVGDNVPDQSIPGEEVGSRDPNAIIGVDVVSPRIEMEVILRDSAVLPLDMFNDLIGVTNGNTFTVRDETTQQLFSVKKHHLMLVAIDTQPSESSAGYRMSMRFSLGSLRTPPGFVVRIETGQIYEGDPTGDDYDETVVPLTFAIWPRYHLKKVPGAHAPERRIRDLIVSQVARSVTDLHIALELAQ